MEKSIADVKEMIQQRLGTKTDEWGGRVVRGGARLTGEGCWMGMERILGDGSGQSESMPCFEGSRTDVSVTESERAVKAS